MAGKARDDDSPRVRKVVQVCMSEAEAMQLQELANRTTKGQVSVAARALLQASLKELQAVA